MPTKVFANWLTEKLQNFSSFPHHKNLDSLWLGRGLESILTYPPPQVSLMNRRFPPSCHLPGLGAAVLLPSSVPPDAPWCPHSTHTQPSPASLTSQNNFTRGA